MLGMLTDLCRSAGTLARSHFASVGDRDVSTKASRDYVTHVDRLIESTLITRIRARHPDHQILGEEGEAGPIVRDPSLPLWIIDPIDGTTNFIRGVPHFAISIAFCERGDDPRYAAVYDPMRDELFTAERGAGLWLNGERRYTTGRPSLEGAVLATALPFRQHAPLADCLAVFANVQRECDDQRRCGAAALDLAWTAIGRVDGFYELGIHAWDTAAGEVLVRAGGGVATDYRGGTTGLLQRRSIVAGASAGLHAGLLAHVAPLRRWLDHDIFAPKA